MTEKVDPPTHGQTMQAHLAHQDIVELINRLIREGIPASLVLVGLATAAADTLASCFGPEHVGPWFARQAVLVAHLQSRY